MSELPLAIAERAMHWQLELQEQPDDPRLSARCDAWRQADPLHEEAWRRAQAFSARLALLREPAGAGLARQTLAHRLQRRQVLKQLAVLVAGAGSAWTLRDTAWVQEALSDYSSAVGEQRRLDLAGDLRVELNTDSAIDLRVDAQARRLSLRRGELLLESAGEDPRPLQVLTAQGWIEALGSRLAIRLWPGETEVLALDGGARLHPREAAPSLLAAGQKARFSASGVQAQGAQQGVELAWRHGMLVAQGQPLAAFLAELGRYRHGYLGCDAALARLPVSGTFPLADTDRVLAAVSATLGLRVQSFSRLWVRLRAIG